MCEWLGLPLEGFIDIAVDGLIRLLPVALSARKNNTKSGGESDKLRGGDLRMVDGSRGGSQLEGRRSEAKLNI
jgi:hypothetical protein